MLVVEDERRLASAVRRGLTAEGFVVTPHDGVDGLHLAREGEYDAVVLDLMLPGLSGYQVCERLRAERNWVPVLILSAKDGEYDQADGLDLGADDYNQALLLRGAGGPAARAAAPGRQAAPGGAGGRRPVPGPGRPDRPPRGRGVELTAREFALLEYLMRRAGQVVPRRNCWIMSGIRIRSPT